jgi:hypothetical protein
MNAFLDLFLQAVIEIVMHLLHEIVVAQAAEIQVAIIGHVVTHQIAHAQWLSGRRPTGRGAGEIATDVTVSPLCQPRCCDIF